MAMGSRMTLEQAGRQAGNGWVGIVQTLDVVRSDLFVDGVTTVAISASLLVLKARMLWLICICSGSMLINVGA